MSISRRTLTEASFFCQRAESEMKSSDLAGKAINRDAIEYFLEASIVFARSVTLHIQKQYKHELGFQDWYAAKQEELRTDPWARFFLESRNFILKKGPLAVRAHYAINVHDVVGVTDSVSVTIERTGGVPADEPPATSQPGEESRPVQQGVGGELNFNQKPAPSTTSVAFYFEGAPDPNRTAEAGLMTYLERLENVVSEAETHFRTGD